MSLILLTKQFIGLHGQKVGHKFLRWKLISNIIYQILIYFVLFLVNFLPKHRDRKLKESSENGE